MKNFLPKAQENKTVLHIGTGMFLWLAVLTFLDCVTSITKYLLLSLHVNNLLNYCCNQVLYTILFVFILFKACNHFAKKDSDIAIVRKIFTVVAATFFSLSLLQFVISMCCYQLIGEIYFTKMLHYNQELNSAANVLQVRYVNIGAEIFRYVALAIIIIRSANVPDES